VLPLPRPKGWVAAALQLLPCLTAADAITADAPLVILAAAAWIYPSPGRSGHREAALWRQREGEGNGYVWGGRGVNTGQAADFEGRNACGMVLR